MFTSMTTLRRQRAAWSAALLSFLMVVEFGSRTKAASPVDRLEVDVANDLIRDARTQLVWQRTIEVRTFTWDVANSYCAARGAGWRLPTRKELLTLVDPTRHEPSIDPVFPSTPIGLFWTSSRNVLKSGSAWVVTFSDGASGAADMTDSSFVRCVR